MARLQSDMKIGAYPLDMWRAEKLAAIFAANSDTARGRLIDPFCNTGEVAAFLAEKWNCDFYGVEIQDDFGKKAQELYGENIIIGDSYNDVSTPLGAYSVVYCNPPYSEDASDETKRAEFKALKHWTKFVQPGGCMIWVVYAHHLSENVAKYVAKNYRSVYLYYWKEKHLGSYTQVALIMWKPRKGEDLEGREEEIKEAFLQPKTFPADFSMWKDWYEFDEGPPKGAKTNPHRIGTLLSESIGSDGKRTVVRDNRFLVPAPVMPDKRFFFSPNFITSEKAIELATRNRHLIDDSLKQLWNQKIDIDIDYGQPIHDARFGQLIALLSAGMMNDLIIETPNGKLAIRGQTQLIEKKVREEEREDEAETVIHTFHTVPTSVIFTLDEKGVITKLSDEQEVAEFLALHSDKLLEHFSNKYSPKFDYHIDPEFGWVFDTYPVKGRYQYMPTQEQVATATAEQILHDRHAVLIGDMSAGKTVMSIAVAIMQRKFWTLGRDEKTRWLNRYPRTKMKDWRGLPPDKPVVVVVPSTIVKKWRKEIETTYPHAVVYTPDNIHELANAFRKSYANTDAQKIYFIIFSYQKMKLGENVSGTSMRAGGRRAYRQEWSSTRGNFWKPLQLAADPITGELFLDEKGRPITQKKLEGHKNTFFHEGDIFLGYREEYEQVRLNWNETIEQRVMKPDTVRAVNHRTQHPGQKHMPLPMFTYKRSFGISKLNDTFNGVVEMEYYDVVVDPRRWHSTNYEELVYAIAEKLREKFAFTESDVEEHLPVAIDVLIREGKSPRLSDYAIADIKAHLKTMLPIRDNESVDEMIENGSLFDFIANNGFWKKPCMRSEWNQKKDAYERIIVGTKNVVEKPYTITRKRVVRSVSGEAVVDEWLAMQGIRPTETVKKNKDLDKLLKKHKLKKYRYGDGVKEIDALMDVIGVSYYDTTAAGTQQFRNPRIPFSVFLRKFLRKHRQSIGLLIMDEIHRAKSTETGDGLATRDMISMSDKALFMTGTLSNGKASSLYNILSMINHLVRQTFPWRRGVPAVWIKTMGGTKREVIVKNEKDGKTGQYTGRRVQHSGADGVEIPATSPMITPYIISKSVVLLLEDLEYKFVELHEKPVIVDMNPTQEALYRSVYQKLHDYNAKCISSGDGSFGGAYYNTCFSLPDLMWRGMDVIHRTNMEKQQRRSEKREIVVMQIPALPESLLYPKEEELIKIVQDALANNERVIVYTKYTGKIDLRPRLAAILEKHVPGSSIFMLSSGGKTSERMSIVERNIERGKNIMMCNPALVSEGVDLIQFQHQVFFDVDNRYIVMAQAAKRTRRPLQTSDVTNWYFAYNDIFQLVSLLNLAKKEKAAAVVTGSDGGALSAVDNDETMSINEMLKKVLSGELVISKEDIQKAFDEKRDALNRYRASPWSKATPRKEYKQGDIQDFEIDDVEDEEGEEGEEGEEDVEKVGEIA